MATRRKTGESTRVALEEAERRASRRGHFSSIQRLRSDAGPLCRSQHLETEGRSSSMAGYKAPDFSQRAQAARDAKAAALEKLKNKPAPDPEVVAQRRAAQEAREAAEAEKRAQRKAAIEAEKAAKEEARAKAKAEAEAAAEAAAAAKRPPILPTAAELKAARDARYAARKARQKR
jgi:hypothetical protein